MPGEITNPRKNGNGVVPSPELAAIVSRWMQALPDKNGEVLTALFSDSDEVRYLGSDRDEVFRGRLVRKGYAEHVSAMPDFQAIGDEIEAFVHNDAGWAIWLGSLHFEAINKTYPYRFTFVLSLESGIWKIVQVHVSTPRSNLDVMGVEHTVFQQLMEAARADGEIEGIEGTATIMFTDIANSTSLAAFVGDRQWSTRIGEHFDQLGSIIAAREGRVVKTLGDGTMSSFTSARAAMLAALDIQKTVKSAADTHSLQLRIGLHTGDVIRTEGDFFGSVVNKAARIATIAEPGSILVSDVARSMAEEGSDLEFGKPQAVQLQGIKGPHQVSRLIDSD